MIVATAFVPATPLLVPEVAQGAADELAELRAACLGAVADLVARAPDRIVVLGGGPQTREHPGDAAGSLAGFGVDVAAGGRGRTSLPTSLTVGAWLLDQTGWPGERVYAEVASAADEVRSAVSRRILDRPGRTALLVVGDGSATRTEKAPRGFDPRSIDVDEDIASALASGDLLLGPVDTQTGATLAAELHVGGLDVWRVAAQTLWHAGRPVTDAQLLHHEAPYGVGYLAALWTWDPVLPPLHR